MATIQDVILSEFPAAAWALTEASGFTFIPYVGGSNLIGTGTFSYRQTGPTALGFSLGLTVGSKLALSFVQQVFPPDTFACWYKLAAVPVVTSDQVLVYTGASASNGTGVYIDRTTQLINFYAGGHGPIPAAVTWPDTNWHLLHVGASGSGIFLAFDGVVILQQNPATNTPVPNQLFIGGDSAAGAAHAMQVAWPAFYTYAETPTQIAADFIAATDPTAALALTAGGASSTSASLTSLLNQILASVRKTY